MKFIAISVFCILAAFPAQASIESLKEAALNQLEINCYKSAVFDPASCEDMKSRFTERFQERKKTGNPFSDAVANLNAAVRELADVSPQTASIAASVFNAPEGSIADTFATVIDSAGVLTAFVVDDEIQVNRNSAPPAQCMNRGEDEFETPSNTCETPEKALRAVIDKVFYEVVATATRKDQRLFKRSRYANYVVLGLAIFGALLGFTFAAIEIFFLIEMTAGIVAFTYSGCGLSTVATIGGTGFGVGFCKLAYDTRKKIIEENTSSSTDSMPPNLSQGPDNAGPQ